MIYKGFLLFYRDDGRVIRNAYSMKSSVESTSRIKQATQVKLSGCFDADKITIEIPVDGQALTRKKNIFHLTPITSGGNIRILIQDAFIGDEKAWVNDIGKSLSSRKIDEVSGFEESGNLTIFPLNCAFFRPIGICTRGISHSCGFLLCYMTDLIQVLKRQAATSGELSGLKMNRMMEEHNSKPHKNPLRIRNIVAQGIHVPRRKLTAEEDHSSIRNKSPQDHDHPSEQPSATMTAANRLFSNLKHKSSRELSKQASTFPAAFKKDHERGGTADHSYGIIDGSLHHGAKAKLTNMSRNLFPKDKQKVQSKDRAKDMIWDKKNDKQKEKDLATPKTSPGKIFGNEKELGCCEMGLL